MASIIDLSLQMLIGKEIVVVSSNFQGTLFVQLFLVDKQLNVWKDEGVTSKQLMERREFFKV
jgi:hypothetical protein